MARVVGMGDRADAARRETHEGPRFTEVELRAMLQGARGMRRDVAEGRWIVETRLAGRSWEVVVEPDEASRRTVVVTAYALDR